ncbi:MAG: glycogen/starch synthase [Lachnoclostridium sp.]|nr:glycogen/starch synthase [Lachnoclostridium sp.]
MTNNKVLYISQEINPYLPESTLSMLGRNVPTGMQGKGFEVRTFMPKYGLINERRNQLHEVIRLSGINLVVDDTDHPLVLKVATLQPSRMQVYFIDNDDFFHRPGTKTMDDLLSEGANDERMIFFIQSVMETAKKLRWQPAIIHCSGWISALAPIYLSRKYSDHPAFAGVKTIYSLYSPDQDFNGTLDPRFTEKLRMAGFDDADLDILGSDPVDAISLHKLAIKYADAIIESTENIPAELAEYARSTGKPILQYPGEDNRIEAYDNFYRSLIGE